MSHPSEAGHWYDFAGNPVYEVPAKNGEPRPTTLRDARKLNLVPSVTGIIRMAAAPGLERWKLDQMLHAALTLPRNDAEAEADWIARVWTDSQETARKASERGTRIHAALQAMYQGSHPGPGELWEHCMGAQEVLGAWHGSPTEAEAEKSFAHELGFGGKVDLNGDHQKKDFTFVVDFKTKEFGPDDELRAWDEHAMQLAAYREGLKLPKARCAICYVSVSHPGTSQLIEIPEADLVRGWDCFKALLSFWQAKSRYWPQMKVAA